MEVYVRKVILVLILSFYSVVGLAIIPNEHQINENIKRGGRPEMADIESLWRQGYKTIINIEDDYNAILIEKNHAESLGFNYIANPLSVNVTPPDDEIEMLLTELQNPDNYPIFIHCKQGRDRTGLVSGLYRVFAESWAAERAYQEMLDLGFRARLKKLNNYYFTKTRGH